MPRMWQGLRKHLTPAQAQELQVADGVSLPHRDKEATGRIVPVRAAADGNADSDFNDHLARMMGEADNCDFPPGAAPQPLLQPLHDSDMVSEAVPARAQQR